MADGDGEGVAGEHHHLAGVEDPAGGEFGVLDVRDRREDREQDAPYPSTSDR
ncbi:hypothetical protein RKD20_000925 [Streptomyces sp. SLBN-8D4]